jgi:hypothetical protein
MRKLVRKRPVHTPFYGNFIENMMRLRSFHSFILQTYPEHFKALDEVVLKLEGKYVPTEEDKKERTFELKLTTKEASLLRKIMKKTRQRLVSLPQFVRNQMLIFAVAYFEYYIKDLIECVCLRNPSMLRSRDKSITYDKLLSLQSLEEIHRYIIEKESISLGYLSYEELSDYFRKKCKIDFSLSGIRKNDLVEIFLVRNVLLHNKGLVNRTFVEKLRNTRYKLGKKVSVGEKTLERYLSLIVKQAEYIDSCFVNKFMKAA